MNDAPVGRQSRGRPSAVEARDRPPPPAPEKVVNIDAPAKSPDFIRAFRHLKARFFGKSNRCILPFSPNQQDSNPDYNKIKRLRCIKFKIDTPFFDVQFSIRAELQKEENKNVANILCNDYGADVALQNLKKPIMKRANCGIIYSWLFY